MLVGPGLERASSSRVSIAMPHRASCGAWRRSPRSDMSRRVMKSEWLTGSRSLRRKPFVQGDRRRGASQLDSRWSSRVPLNPVARRKRLVHSLRHSLCHRGPVPRTSPSHEKSPMKRRNPPHRPARPAQVRRPPRRAPRRAGRAHRTSAGRAASRRTVHATRANEAVRRAPLARTTIAVASSSPARRAATSRSRDREPRSSEIADRWCDHERFPRSILPRFIGPEG